MATFDGNLALVTIYTDPPGTAIDGSGGYDPTVAFDPVHVVSGARSNTQPVDELEQTKQGTSSPAFGFLDFYNRIHIVRRLNLGAIVSAQIRELSVWNAFFVPRTLLAIDAANDTGLILDEPGSLPLTFGPLQERIYELSISEFGPAVVDATYTFTFDNRSYVVDVQGVRVVAWSWEPNWIDPVRERMEWLTDLMRSYNGTEQATSLRDGPRWFWQFTYDVKGTERRRFENVLYGWGARIFALPIWPDGEDLAGEVLAGALTIPVTAATRDYHVNGIGMLIGGSGGVFESFEVLAVLAGSITIKRPLVLTWPAGARVYPARTARLMDPRSMKRGSADYARGEASFRCEEQLLRTAATEPTYRGYPVNEFQVNWREQPDVEYARKLSELDLQTGNVVFDDESGVPEIAARYQWTLNTRAEIEACRQFAFSRKGRARSVWLPSWSIDLILAVPLGAGATNIDVKFAGLAQYAEAGVHRRDIRVELKDGTVLYRRVSGFVVVDPNTERMTLEAALGIGVAPADVVMISWMSLARLDMDSVELEWQNRSFAESAVALRSVNNGV